MHSELTVSQYQKFRNHDRLNSYGAAIREKEHIIELRKEFARPGYFSPKLELEESSIDNSSEVIIDTKNPNSDDPKVIPELDISQPLSDQLLADTKNLETLETKSKRDYVKETSTKLKDQALWSKIYNNDRNAIDPDTGKLTTNGVYVNTKIETYCKEVLKAVRTVITRHASNPKLLNKELIGKEISLEISLSSEACIDSILKLIPEIKDKKSVQHLETVLIESSNLIISDISDISARKIDNERQALGFENEFEQELEHNLLRLGYKTAPTTLANSIIPEDSSSSSNEIEEGRQENPKQNTKLESLKTRVTNRITSLIGNKKMSWETCRSKLLETKINVLDILDEDERKAVSLRELGYDFNLVGSIDKSPKEFTISMTTPSIENDHEFSIKNTKPQTFISFQVKLPNSCKGLSFIPHKRKLEDDESTHANSDISERGSNELVEESEPAPRAREIPRKSLITRLGNAFKLSLGMTPDSKTSIFRNIARIFTTTPISIYIFSILTAFLFALFLSIGITILICVGIIIWSWFSRFCTAITDACIQNLTDLSLEASGTKYRKRKFVGAVIGWVITTPIALGLNILKGVVTFGNNDFSILRTDGEERLLREIVLIRTLEAISVLGTLVIFAGLVNVGFIAFSLSSERALHLVIQLPQLSNSSFSFVYEIAMDMLSSRVALSTISTLTIIAVSLAGSKCLIFLIKDALLPLIQLIKNNITLATSEAKDLLGRKERFTDSTNTLPPLRGMIGLEVLYPVMQMLQEAYPGFSELPDNEQQVLILQHMVGSEYVLDQYRTCLELSKIIAKYRAQGANTLKEIINKISRGVFNRLEDKNMIIMLRRLCDNDTEELDSPDFLNEVENNLSKSLQILLPFVSVPNHYNDIDPDRILKDSVEYKNKIYNKYFDLTEWKKHDAQITVDTILEIGQFPAERRKYIHAMLDQSRSLVADFDKMSKRQKRINAEKLATKSLKPDWLLKQQYGENWKKHRYTLNYKDSLLCRSIELDKALPVANFGVSSKNIEIVIEQKLGYYFGNTEERRRLEEAMYPKTSIWLSIARFFGFKSELAKPKAIKSTNGIVADYTSENKLFIPPISGEEAAEISFDPENFSVVPCPIYPSIENVKYLTAEYRAKSEEFKELNKALKKQSRKILKLTMELKRNIEPYMHRQDERLLARYNAIKQKIAEESQTEAYLIRLLNLCEQIMHFDKVRLQQLADLNKDNIEKGIAITRQEVPNQGRDPNTTEDINAIRREYNLIAENPGLVNFSEKFINPVFITSSNLQRVTSNLDNLQRDINYTCESILDISFKISEVQAEQLEKADKSAHAQKELDILTLRLKDAENKLIIYLAEARAITKGALNQLGDSPSNRNPINIDTARTLLKKYRSLVPNPILLKRLNLVRFFRGWSDAYDQLLFLADTDLGKSIKSNRKLIKEQQELLSELTVKKTAQEKNQAILHKLRNNTPEYQELSTVIKKEKETIEKIKAQIKNNSNLLLSSSEKFFYNVEETSYIISSLHFLAITGNLPKNFEELVLQFAENFAEQDILEKDEGLRDYITKPTKEVSAKLLDRVSETLKIEEVSPLKLQELAFKKSQLLYNILQIQVELSELKKDDDKSELKKLECQILDEKYRQELDECNKNIARHPKNPVLIEEIEHQFSEIDAELSEKSIQSTEGIVKVLKQQESLIIKKRSSSAIISNITKIKNSASNLYQKGMKDNIIIYYATYPTLESEKEYLLEFVPKICMMNESEKQAFCIDLSIGFIDAKNVDKELYALQNEINLIIKDTHVDPIEKVENELEEHSAEIGKILEEDATQAMKALNTLEETLKEDLKRLESEIGADIPAQQLKAVNPMFEHIEQLENIYYKFEVPILYAESVLHARYKDHIAEDLKSSLSEADDLYSKKNKMSLKLSEENLRNSSEQDRNSILVMEESEDQSLSNSSEILLNLDKKNDSELLLERKSIIDFSELNDIPEERSNFLQKWWKRFTALFSKSQPKIKAKKLTNPKDIKKGIELYKALHNLLKTNIEENSDRLTNIFLYIAQKQQKQQKQQQELNIDKESEEELTTEVEDYNKARYAIGAIYRRMLRIYDLIKDQERENLEQPADIERHLTNKFISVLANDYKERRDKYYNDAQYFEEIERLLGSNHFNTVIKPILERRIFYKNERDPQIKREIKVASSQIVLVDETEPEPSKQFRENDGL